MATFVYTGEEYINADHIISIDASPGTATIWIRLDTGDKYARSKKYLEEILDILGYYDSRKVEIKFYSLSFVSLLGENRRLLFCPDEVLRSVANRRG